MPGGSDLEAKVSRQVEAAVADADVVLFVVDATVGVTDDDEAVANWLRRDEHARCCWSPTRPTTTAARTSAGSSCALGLGEPYPVSALHGRRAGDLLDEVISLLLADEAGEPPASTVDLEDADELWKAGEHAAAAGRHRRAAQRRQEHAVQPAGRRGPLGRARHAPARPATRSTRSSRPRTGRSCSSTPPACAGAAEIDDSAEYYSLVRALRAIDDADIALLVIDATEGVTGQDQRLAERVDAAGCPIVVMLNKWELIDDAEAAPRRCRPSCSASWRSSATRRS